MRDYSANDTVAGKPGIRIEIPGFGRLELRRLVSDFSGTLSKAGKFTPGVQERLLQLGELIEIHILTSDTFGTVRDEFVNIPVHLEVLTQADHHIQKRDYLRERSDPARTAAFGNGANDRLLLQAAKEAGGLAVAVDNGEGCAVETVLGANLLIAGAANALDLLLDPNRLKASLRF